MLIRDGQGPAGLLEFLRYGPGYAALVGQAEDYGGFLRFGHISLVHNVGQSKDWPLHRQMRFISNALEGFLDFFYGIAEDYGTAVGSCHWAIGFCQRAEEPFHFCLV